VNQTLVAIRRDVGKLGDFDIDGGMQRLEDESSHLQYKTRALAELKEQAHDRGTTPVFREEAAQKKLDELRSKSFQQRPAEV
jgi:hypothetical protein